MSISPNPFGSPDDTALYRKISPESFKDPIDIPRRHDISVQISPGKLPKLATKYHITFDSVFEQYLGDPDEPPTYMVVDRIACMTFDLTKLQEKIQVSGSISSHWEKKAVAFMREKSEIAEENSCTLNSLKEKIKSAATQQELRLFELACMNFEAQMHCQTYPTLLQATTASILFRWKSSRKNAPNVFKCFSFL